MHVTASILSGINAQDIVSFLAIGAIFLYSVVLHEIAHGYAAYKCGDDTAYLLGRLTLNPIKHIHPFLSVILPIGLLIITGGKMIFGGAKPVPVNPYRFRSPVKADIFVSSAGVLVNFFLAVFFAIILHILLKFSLVVSDGEVLIDERYYLSLHVVAYSMFINLLLAVFNLVPIPPLDGSHLFKYLLPSDMRQSYQRLGMAGMIFIMVLVYFNGFSYILRYSLLYFTKIMMLDFGLVQSLI